jgi:excisionase family DNA binding protein
MAVVPSAERGSTADSTARLNPSRAAQDEREVSSMSRVPTQYFETERLLLPSEVAHLFRVDPKTVSRWAKAGRLPCIRTLGGHSRFRESVIYELLTRVERVTP